jgi:hypothetical protein
MHQVAERNMENLFAELTKYKEIRVKQLGNLKTEDPEKYRFMKKELTFVKFYQIKGTDLDSEVAEYVQGTDIVKLLK